MNNYLFLSLVVIFNYFVYVLGKNDYYLISIRGEKVVYDEASKTIQQKIDTLVNDRMNDIYDVIADNTEAYGKKDEKIEEITEASKLRKRGKKSKFLFINRNRPQNLSQTEDESSKFEKRSATEVELKEKEEEELIPFDSILVIRVCPVSDYYVVIAYLPESLVEEVKSVPNVISVNKAGKLKNYSKYYNEKEILKETKWKDVTVQESPFDFEFRNIHLSMMSQGKYYNNSTHPYDNNYYYPSTAGKGIDIYVIDDGLDTSLSEENFDTYKGTEDERVIKCDGAFYYGQFHTVSNDKRCSVEIHGTEEVTDSFNHGTPVAISAMGTLNGVAKKANLHSLAIDYYSYDVLSAFDYIKQYAKPHKSVVNISSGGIFDKAEFSVKEIQDKINELNEYGIIIVVSAGNLNRNYCKGHSDVDYIYGIIDGVINVGALNNGYSREGNLENIYEKASYSNYGACVDLFAPGTISITNNKNQVVFTEEGTSFASPFVAGLAATIMAENSDVEFNYESLKANLIELSIKDAIKGLDDETPNRMANNGKTSIYGGGERCDNASGENKCNGQCCTKYGVCADPNDFANESMCLIEMGCQPEFGICNKTCFENGNYEDYKCQADECCTRDICVKADSEQCLIENGCQPEYGNCSSKIENDCQSEYGNCSTEIQFKRCGKDYNNKKCGKDECCTQNGLCVNVFEDEYDECFIENGCLKKFSNQCFSTNPLTINLYNKKYHELIYKYICKNELRDFESKCLLGGYAWKSENFDIKKRNDICKKYQNNKCQKVISQPEKYFKSCKRANNMDDVESTINGIKYYSFFCAKKKPTLKNEYCTSDGNAVNYGLSDVIIDEFCVYDECREAYLEILKHDYEKMKEEVESKTSISDKAFRAFKAYEKAIKLLSKKKCDELSKIDFSSMP